MERRDGGGGGSRPARALRLVLPALAAGALAAAPPSAGARVVRGDVLEYGELPTLAGGREPLWARARVNVVVFWRPDQERSLDTLAQLARCEPELEARKVHVVAVVPDAFAAADVRAVLERAKLRAPVLVDAEDAVYGRLELRQHPVVLVVDGAGRVALAQPYLKLRYCEIVKAHVRFLLKEIDAAQLAAAVDPPRATFPDEDKRHVARRYVVMGQREAAAGRCDKALASFGKALEIVPGDPEAKAGVERCGGER